MNGTYLTMIAEKVLCEEGQFSVSTLIKQGRNKEAKERVLEAVDVSYWDWRLSFTEAAEFYNMLDLTSERASKFPQRHNKAFF
jgi:hypothetical protein